MKHAGKHASEVRRKMSERQQDTCAACGEAMDTKTGRKSSNIGDVHPRCIKRLPRDPRIQERRQVPPNIARPI
jgi:hypothetical protein